MIQRFHNILFVSHVIRDESEALQSTIKLASKNKAQLRILIISPPLENILQKIACSILALKPLGFVSPVKAY